MIENTGNCKVLVTHKLVTEWWTHESYFFRFQIQILLENDSMIYCLRFGLVHLLYINKKPGLSNYLENSLVYGRSQLDCTGARG